MKCVCCGFQKKKKKKKTEILKTLPVTSTSTLMEGVATLTMYYLFILFISTVS